MPNGRWQLARRYWNPERKLLHFDSAAFYGLQQGFVVALGLIGVRSREFHYCVVEGVAGAEVTANRRRISRAPLRQGNCPAARISEIREVGGIFRIDRHRNLHVAQLAHVKMSAGLQTDHPAQEYVAGGLHQALAINHPLSVGRKHTAGGVWLEHRSARFLDLQKQGSGLRVAEQRYLAERPDTADADDFEGHIEQLEPIE